MIDSLDPRELRGRFLLETDIVYLNHGSFGACPREVFDEYQRIQLELEREPVRFLATEFTTRMATARGQLAAYLGASSDDLVYVPNTTTGLNIVARSLALRPGDEVLTTDHEYGALDRMWSYVCGKAKARYVRVPISVPVPSTEDVIQSVWSHVTNRTRVLFLSHITSPTALILPVAPLVERARKAGILSIIDGAHAPGQLPLDLTSLGADVYAGNCHKWMLAPKGSAFLHVRREVQSRIEPLIVSWGWEAERPGPSRFVDYHEWQGTHDISSYLAVPAAIHFMETHNWRRVADRCRSLLRECYDSLLAVTGGPPLSPNSGEWLGQMASFVLPMGDAEAVQRLLYDEYRIEVPVVRWNDRTVLRVSINAYNERSDLECLRDALSHLASSD